MEQEFWDAVAGHIATATGRPFAPRSRRPVGGGCINQAEALHGRDAAYFVKHNDARYLDMFEAEAAGLTEILATRTVRVPRPIAWGAHAERAYLVLEHLELRTADGPAMRRLGEQLAALHRATAPRHGFHRDNTIGSTPQHNAWADDWVDFWKTRRLGPQLELAAQNGHGGRLLDQGARLLDECGLFFDTYRPAASLLHGDLWGGNAAALPDAEPVIFDPAAYYGDRETDLAMTELFGGFGAEFYAAYRHHAPLDAGYKARKPLYNLYHVLNHLNLFGASYGPQAERLIAQALSELH